MEKQIQRAEILLKDPGKIKKVKFLKTDKNKPSLNQDLIDVPIDASNINITLGYKTSDQYGGSASWSVPY